MELKGHNLIIISLDSHFSKMERNVLTHHPLPQFPSPPPALWNNFGGQRWFTAAVGHKSHWPPPVMQSARGGSSAQSLETSAQISANASQIKFAILGSLGKTTRCQFGFSQLEGLSHQHSINLGQQNFVRPGPQTPSGKQRV